MPGLYFFQKELCLAKKNVKGVCALCKKNKILCKSHYLGRALYELSREGSDHPVVMTPDSVMLTPRQIWAHLLCTACEKLFDEKGEKPTFKLINRGEGRAVDFSLLNRMKLALAIKRTNGSITYSGESMGIDTEALAYFALSLLWRGSAHKWKTSKGKTTSVDLGEYAEPIRRYLLGETGMPDGVYVLVGVCTDLGSQLLVLPPWQVSGAGYTMYSILVRGIWFHVIADKKAPNGTIDLCCVRSKQKVIHLENCEERFKRATEAFGKVENVDERLKSPERLSSGRR